MRSDDALEASDRDHDGLMQAVVDAPDGFAVIDAPSDPRLARELRRRWGNEFWCTTLASGCGGPLRLAAGDVRRPYFRHRPKATCRLAQNPSRAPRAYEHLHYQRELVTWLERQGLRADIEHRFGAEGRADLHVEVDGVGQSIEIQLSRISDEEVRERDDVYRRHVSHVTWLFGTGPARALASSAQAADGVALLVRRDGQTGHVEVGVLDYDDNERWSPLDDCELRNDGLWTPHLQSAKDEYRRVLEERARQAQRQAEERAAADRRAAEAVAATQRVRHRPRQPQPTEPPPVIHHAARGPERATFGTLAWWQEVHAERVEWMPDQGWGWSQNLPEPERTAAQVLAYIVQRIYANGPVKMLHPPDGGDGHRVVAALKDAQLIRTYERGGIARWERDNRRS